MSYELLAPGHMAHAHTVSFEASAQAVAARLISEGVEFHVEPLPDDHWHFTVKAEGYPTLRAALVGVGQLSSPCVITPDWKRCLTHDCEENAGHAFDTGRLSTLD